MFTKQHYEAIARIIDNQTLLNDQEPEGTAVHKLGLVMSLADMFKSDNLRFDTNRFFQACGYEQGVTTPY